MASLLRFGFTARFNPSAALPAEEHVMKKVNEGIAAILERSISNNPISRIVLASSSPRRKELVATLGLSLPVYILSSNVGEEVPSDWEPWRIVEELAVRKAKASAEMLKQSGETETSLIIGADTIVVSDGEALGKPADQEEAVRMLESLQGRPHEVYTGIACLRSDTGGADVAHRMTRVWMKQLTRSKIERYVATGEPMDKAGAYGIQGLGSTLVDRIEGCYFNVVGLSVTLLSDMLERQNINVF